MKYRPEIDGLRALAVLPVVLYHAEVRGFSGGYVGVDIFFVISGFLITSILRNELASGTFSLVAFYERRARRILPALYAMLAVCSPVVVLVMWPAAIEEFARSSLATVIFSSNIHFWHQTGYFATEAALKPLLHTWSLAVEEQFYLVYPLLLALTWTWGQRRVRLILFVLLLASLIVAEWGTVRHPDAAFYLLPTRAWELLVGAIVSLRTRETAKAINLPMLNAQLFRECVSALGLTMVLVSIVLFDESMPFPGIVALVPTLGSALVIAFASADTAVGKALSRRPMVAIGLISYSTYLWHQPVFVFARVLSGTSMTLPSQFALTTVAILLGWVSWRFVEVPLRRRAAGSHGRVFAAAAAGAVALGVVAVWGVRSHGFERFVYEARFDDGERRVFDLIRRSTASPARTQDDGLCKFAVSTLDKAADLRFRACAARNGAAVIVVGDSHAMGIFNALYSADAADFLFGVVRAGCRPYGATRDCPFDDFLEFAKRNSKDIQFVFYHQSGSYLMKDSRGRFDSDDTFVPGREYSIDWNAVKSAAEYVRRLSNYVQATWLGPHDEARVSLTRLRSMSELEVPKNVIRVFGALDSAIVDHMDRSYPAFPYVSLHRLIAMSPTFLLVDGCVTFRDDDHFSACGEQLVGRLLMRRWPDVTRVAMKSLARH